MNLLVTGGSGLVGSAITADFKPEIRYKGRYLFESFP